MQYPEEEDEDIEHTGTIIWNYYKSVGVQADPRMSRAASFVILSPSPIVLN